MSTTNSLAAVLMQRAMTAPDAVYLEDARSERVVTQLGLWEAVDAWHAHFTALDIAPSGAVLVDVVDPLAFAVVHLATIATGRRSVPIDPGQPASELERVDGLVRGASLVVTDHRADAVAATLPTRSVTTVEPSTFLPVALVAGPVPTENPWPAGEAPPCSSPRARPVCRRGWSSASHSC